jgi:hypothetical protein
MASLPLPACPSWNRSGPRSVRGSPISLNSALSFWDLTDEVPAEVHLAVPRGSHRPRISYPPVRAHVFAAHTFDLGRERLRLDSGEEIDIYSQERSVVDAVRLRGRVGTGVAYEALRRYLRRPGGTAASHPTAEGRGTHGRRSGDADGSMRLSDFLNLPLTNLPRLSYSGRP